MVHTRDWKLERESCWKSLFGIVWKDAKPNVTSVCELVLQIICKENEFLRNLFRMLFVNKINQQRGLPKDYGTSIVSTLPTGCITKVHFKLNCWRMQNSFHQGNNTPNVESAHNLVIYGLQAENGFHILKWLKKIKRWLIFHDT